MGIYPESPKKTTTRGTARVGGKTVSYKVALAALDAAGGIAAIANPEGATLIIDSLVIDVTTKTTGACTADAGVAANATTSNDSLIDGVDIGTATGTFDSQKDAGTNGAGARRWGATEYLTISKATGAAAGLVGSVYVNYHLA